MVTKKNSISDNRIKSRKLKGSAPRDNLGNQFQVMKKILSTGAGNLYCIREPKTPHAPVYEIH